jgi:hypothetical protein
MRTWFETGTSNHSATTFAKNHGILQAGLIDTRRSGPKTIATAEKNCAVSSQIGSASVRHSFQIAFCRALGSEANSGTAL